MSTSVDLNCDMGESFGVYDLGYDAELLDHVTSANIACGYHAGDPGTMRATVRLALEKNVAIGAHPGLPDLIGFGRRDMKISPQDAHDIVTYQIGALQAFVQSEGGILRHVKPHGALYNMAARDSALAMAIADAVFRINPELILFGLSGSCLMEAGHRRGLRTASEVFADRSYESDGTLTPRTCEGSLIASAERSIQQVIEVLQTGKVETRQGTRIDIQADTICLHGDGPSAVEFARRIRAELDQSGIIVKAV